MHKAKPTDQMSNPLMKLLTLEMLLITSEHVYLSVVEMYKK